MRRREVLALIAGIAPAALTPRIGSAQQPITIGFLSSADPLGYAPQLEALRLGLRDHGYVEGGNVIIEYRWAHGKYERLSELAAELVHRQVRLIVTHGTPASQAAKNATGTIPIVIAVGGDVVATGLVQSIARPGANITGSTFFFPELNAKRLELIKAAVPHIVRVGVLLNPDNPASTPVLKAMEIAGQSLGVEIRSFPVRGPDEFLRAFSEMNDLAVDAVELIDDAMLIVNAAAAARLAVESRLPSIGFREFAERGGLIAYAVDFPVLWRRAGTFVDKILKGAQPADLPVEQVTRFQLVINLRTAKVLGLTISPTFLARADEVIE
jgi:putative ABC transport system substrate-binding protein